MAIQPKKKKVNYEENFSNEINDLVTYIVNEVSTNIAFDEITPEIFVMSALEKQDSLLYKSVNGFLTGRDISAIRDEIYNYVTEGNLDVVRPGRKINYSENLKNYFFKANEIIRELGVPLVTSDVVLLALMRGEKSTSRLKKLFTERGYTKEVAFEMSSRMRDAIKAIKVIDKEAEVPVEDEAEDDVPEQQSSLGAFLSGLSSTLGIPMTSGVTVAVVDGSQFVGFDELMEAHDKQEEEKRSKSRKKDRSPVPYFTCINEEAELGILKPLVGREKEIDLIAKALARRDNNNVAIVGNAGVGKSAIVNGLARMVEYGNAPASFRNAEFWRLDLVEFLSGVSFKGQLQSRVSEVIESVMDDDRKILVFDCIRDWDTEMSDYDLVLCLKPMFESRLVKTIVVGSLKSYTKVFEKMGMFSKIEVAEPTEKECVEIIHQTKSPYESYHHVAYEDDAIEACVRLAKRYVTEKSLPASAFEILDEAGASKRLQAGNTDRVNELQNDLYELNSMREAEVLSDNFEEVKNLDTYIDEAKKNLAKEIDKQKRANKIYAVTEEDIYNSVSDHTGVPVSKVSTTDLQVLSKLDEKMKTAIVGQDEAISIVTKAIKRNKIGVSNEGKPMLTCLCIGSTGCGKTLLAKILAKEVFGSEKDLVRFDMSEYADKTSVNKLIGSSAGYVGYDDGGLLTNAIKKKKHAVLLVDEIEKAADEVYNLFLQVMDEGFLTDNTGTKVDFRNTIIIMTSNIGVKDALNSKPMGYNADVNADKKSIIEREMKKKFPPEFINRLDEIVYFNTLSDDNLLSICSLELDKVRRRFANAGFNIIYDEHVPKYIFDGIQKEKEYGARPIARKILRDVENVITDLVVETGGEKKTFDVNVVDGKLEIIPS